jgi:hypothetical protein
MASGEPSRGDQGNGLARTAGVGAGNLSDVGVVATAQESDRQIAAGSERLRGGPDRDPGRRSRRGPGEHRFRSFQWPRCSQSSIAAPARCGGRLVTAEVTSTSTLTARSGRPPAATQPGRPGSVRPAEVRVPRWVLQRPEHPRFRLHPADQVDPPAVGRPVSRVAQPRSAATWERARARPAHRIGFRFSPFIPAAVRKAPLPVYRPLLSGEMILGTRSA